jgi:hypothetical protein
MPIKETGDYTVGQTSPRSYADIPVAVTAEGGETALQKQAKAGAGR